MDNYITQNITQDAVYVQYRDNGLFFGSTLLVLIVDKNYFYTLKRRTNNDVVFGDEECDGELLDITSDPFELIDEIRITLAKCLIFIHTWIDEHRDANSLLERDHDTYGEFFVQVLTTIIDKETIPEVNRLANRLKTSIVKISPFLGSYKSNLRQWVHKWRYMAELLVGLVMFQQMCSTYS
jgi:hypothetical protein